MSEVIKIAGTITRIEPEQQITDKLRKQNVVLVTEGTYPETLAAEFINDKIDLLTGYAEGQRVSISVNIRGREHNGRVYINLAGWKIEMEGTTTQPTPAKTGFQSANTNPALRAQPRAAQIASDEDSDLPF